MVRGIRIKAPLQLVVALAFGWVLGPTTTAAEPEKPPYRWEKPLVWDENDGPEAREHGAVLLDEESDRAILIGGLGYKPEQFTPLDDVWQLSLKTDRWVRLRPTTKVPAGGSRRVAQVPGRKLAYLFGGLIQDQLVRVDFSKETPAFTEIPQDNAPAPRGLHAFAYDPKLDRFVLFGGLGGDLEAGKAVLFNDIWTMKLDGGRAKWTELKVKGGPTPRSGFAYGYDTEGGRLIVFGGTQGAPPAPSNEASDTWVLHLREEPPVWRQGVDGAPPPRRNACFVWDQGERRLFVCCGAKGANELSQAVLHILDLKPAAPRWRTWVLADGPAVRASGSGLHDPARGRLLMGFGNADRTYRDLYPLRYK